MSAFQMAVPDEIITQIIKARIAKDDCVTKGWLLDGYPSTSSQAQSLQSEGIVCDKFIVLSCSAETAKARAEQSGTYADLKEKLVANTSSFNRNIRTVRTLVFTLLSLCHVFGFSFAFFFCAGSASL